MTDWTELKRLAGEAGGIEWHADMAVANDGAESRAIYHRPKPYHVVEIIETPDSALDNADCIHSESVWQFIAAANPKTILTLIAENERLSDMANRLADEGISIADERDQLRAEVEALRKDALRWKCVRNAIPMQSPYAVWREGSHLVLGKDADELVDNFLADKDGSA